MDFHIDKDYALWGLGVIGVVIVTIIKLTAKGFLVYIQEAKEKIDKDIVEAKEECEESVATLENDCLDRDKECKERVDKLEEVHRDLWDGLDRRASKEYMYKDVVPRLDKLSQQMTDLIQHTVTKSELTHLADTMNGRLDQKADKK